MLISKTLIPKPLFPPPIVPKPHSHLLSKPHSTSPDPHPIEHLLLNPSTLLNHTKMDRRPPPHSSRFPYLDRLTVPGRHALTAREVVAELEAYILEPRREKMRRVVDGRSYAVSLVVEGLTDFGNVSAAFRSADALGVQSVHVVSRDKSKRYRDNRHVSRGAEKWLDIELWQSPMECFEELKRRGYRVATTHLGTETVSIYDMDWSLPTAIVVGNEQKGISDEALRLADLHCSIPMNGMVDSLNVSVAAGILMHHAVCDRISRLGSHGDLTSEEKEILLAEFFLRHRERTFGVMEEYAKRQSDGLTSKL